MENVCVCMWVWLIEFYFIQINVSWLKSNWLNEEVSIALRNAQLEQNRALAYSRRVHTCIKRSTHTNHLCEFCVSPLSKLMKHIPCLFLSTTWIKLLFFLRHSHCFKWMQNDVFWFCNLYLLLENVKLGQRKENKVIKGMRMWLGKNRTSR